MNALTQGAFFAFIAVVSSDGTRFLHGQSDSASTTYPRQVIENSVVLLHRLRTLSFKHLREIGRRLH